MRHLISICIAILISLSVSGQKQHNTAISLYTSAFNSGYFKNNGMGDWTRRELDRTFLIGAGYRIGLSRWLSLNTGLEYVDYRFSIQEKLSFPPFTEYPPYQRSMSLLSVPIFAQADFLRYVFVQAGGMVDVQLGNQVTNRNFSGLGIQLSAGLKYDTKNNIGFFFNPFLQWHRVVKFEESFANYTRFDSYGIRLGISYRL